MNPIEFFGPTIDGYYLACYTAQFSGVMHIRLPSGFEAKLRTGDVQVFTSTTPVLDLTDLNAKIRESSKISLRENMLAKSQPNDFDLVIYNDLLSVYTYGLDWCYVYVIIPDLSNTINFN